MTTIFDDIIGQLQPSPLTDGGRLDFQLPPELEAGEPPEVRGLSRDGVRLMVSTVSDNHIEHLHFREIGRFLREGDLLVLNTSGTLNAALDAMREDGTKVELHLSTRLPAGLWIVELRMPVNGATDRFYDAAPGDLLRLPAGGVATLHTTYGRQGKNETESLAYRNGKGGSRLWIATLDLPVSLDDYLGEHGFPIRYRYVRQQWPLSYYQTVYATERGSAEMPSAGRAFTAELIARLLARGVAFAPLILHTGVASLEEHEAPYDEYYRVSASTARAVNAAREGGGRVIAVGTTVVRALETVVDDRGVVHPGEGWTDMVVTPERGIRSVNGLLTGLHEPRASHLAMLQALSGREHLRLAYNEALHERYLWHEFGDLHLILP